MRKATLKNGMKLIYEKRDASIASFCIALDAGALREEDGFLFGTAHALEHMLYKGTKTRSEADINRISDEVFGFSNAMTLPITARRTNGQPNATTTSRLTEVSSRKSTLSASRATDPAANATRNSTTK